MANDKNSSSQTPLSLFPPGTLNPWARPEFDKEISRFKGHGGVASANATDLIKHHFKDEVMTSNASHILAKPLVGLCFRIDQGGSRSGGKIKPHNWVDKIYRAGGTELQTGTVIQIKVWIPEVWFGAVPDKMGDIPEGPHHKDIDRLPTFYYLKDDLPLPKPGQLVEVQFNDPKNLDLGGKYLGLLSDEPGIPSIKSLGSPKDAMEKKCKNLGPIGDSQPPIRGDNLAQGSVGRPLPVNRSNNSGGENQIFGNKASCRGTSRRWMAALEAQGLHIGSLSFYEKFKGNGFFEGEHREATGRETIIYFPKYGVDLIEMPPEVMFFFHDSGGFTDTDFKRIAKAMKTLNDKNRNYIFVVTELPWSRGLSPNQRAKSTNEPDSAFSGEIYDSDNLLAGSSSSFQIDPGTWSKYEENVMSVIKAIAKKWAGSDEDMKARKTFIAVGSGGIALANAITKTGGKPNKVVMANADHLVFESLGAIGEEYISSNQAFMLTITRGISSTPLSINSVNYLKTKGIKPSSVGSLAVAGKFGLIGFTDYELIVQNSITYTDPGLVQDGGVIYFPSTIDESDSMTSEAPISKPDVPATLGQGKNVDPLPSPTEPDIPPELRDLMDKRAAQENLIKAAEAEIAFNIKGANYAAADDIKNNKIKKAKDEISRLTKQINEKMKAFEPKKRPAGNIDPACPEASMISTVSETGMGTTQADKNKKPWKAVGYKFSSGGVLTV